jgi:hypothetical protein
MPYQMKSRSESRGIGDDFVIVLWPEHLGALACAACRKRPASIGKNGFGRSDRLAPRRGKACPLCSVACPASRAIRLDGRSSEMVLIPPRAISRMSPITSGSRSCDSEKDCSGTGERLAVVSIGSGPEVRGEPRDVRGGRGYRSGQAEAGDPLGPAARRQRAQSRDHREVDRR